MKILILLLLSISITIISIMLIFFKYKTKENLDMLPKTYISMTTIPERLEHEWFYNNLKRNISILDKNQKIILNVPFVSLKGEKYLIPANIYDLQGDKFMINVCDHDEGPITKLLPSLRNKIIQDYDIIIICDDDIVYKINTFKKLEQAVLNNKHKISSMCHSLLEGFKGFAFIKKVMKGILDIKIPETCIRIDDDVINWYVKQNNIPIYAVDYENNNDTFCGIDVYPNQKDAHPEWEELRSDNREPMIKNCMKDISELN